MDLQEFWSGLSDTSRDTFLEVVKEMASEASPERLDRIQRKLRSLVKEINKTNQRREELSAKLERVDAVLDTLNAADKNGSLSLEMRLFKNLLFGIRSELKREIGVLRPEDRLRQKFEQTRRKEQMLQRAQIAEQLFETRLKPLVEEAKEESGDAQG